MKEILRKHSQDQYIISSFHTFLLSHIIVGAHLDLKPRNLVFVEVVQPHTTQSTIDVGNTLPKKKCVLKLIDFGGAEMLKPMEGNRFNKVHKCLN